MAVLGGLGRMVGSGVKGLAHTGGEIYRGARDGDIGRIAAAPLRGVGHSAMEYGRGVADVFGLGGSGGGANGFDAARADLLPLYQQAQDMYSPYAGLAGVLPQMQQALGEGKYMSNFSNAPTFESFNYNSPMSAEQFKFDFNQDPGYKFAVEEANRGLAGSLAASGMRGGGNALKEFARLNTGMAQQGYGDAYGRALETFNVNQAQNNAAKNFNFNSALQGYQANQGSRLGLAQLGTNIEQMRAQQLQQQFGNQMGIAGLGFGAVGAQAGLKTGLAGNLVDLQIGKYQADEARKIAEQNSQNQLFGSALTAGALALPALMSDQRLKENIVFKEKQNGHNMYIFNYIGSPQKFEGVIAQEVLETRPDAVETLENGYLAVNYDKLGLEMRVL